VNNTIFLHLQYTFVEAVDCEAGTADTIIFVSPCVIPRKKWKYRSNAHDTLAGNSRWIPAPLSGASCNKICASFQR